MRCALHGLLFLVFGCSSAAVESAKPERATSTAVVSATWFKAEVYCPPGTVYEGTVCKPLVVINCPPGTKFEQEVGCVGVVVDKPPPSASFRLPAPPGPAPPSCACLPSDALCAVRCQQRGPGPQPPPPAVPQSGTRR
jgi:hypothetical protein